MCRHRYRNVYRNDLQAEFKLEKRSQSKQLVFAERAVAAATALVRSLPAGPDPRLTNLVDITSLTE